MRSFAYKSFIILLLISFFLPWTASGAVIEIRNPLKAENFLELLDAIIDFIAYYLAPPIAVIMIIVAGFHFVTAIGDPEKINTAKRIILWVLIGLLVILSAEALIEFFKQVFWEQPPPPTP